MPVPLLTAFQSFFQGQCVAGHRTRAVSEAVALGLTTTAAVLTAGVIDGGVTGIYVALAGSLLGYAAQVSWLRWRSRSLELGR